MYLILIIPNIGVLKFGKIFKNELFHKNMKYVYKPQFMSIDIINDILRQIESKEETPGQVGSNVNKIKKNRTEHFFNAHECLQLDNLLFEKNVFELIQSNFNVSYLYREKWKLGKYYGSENGHYIAHKDTQGGMLHRKVSVIICCSFDHEYEGGCLEFPDLKQKFKLNKGDIILFDPNIKHQVLPVTSGLRKVLISFLFDLKGALVKSHFFEQKCNYIVQKHNYIYPILPNSGPGNQLIGFKEAYIIARICNRKLILPNIIQHYVTGNKIWNFEKIFKLMDYTNFERNIKLKPQQILGLHPNYFETPLKHEKYIDKEPLCEVVLSPKRCFNNMADIKMLQITQDICGLKHIYNNVRTKKCPINGCYTCKYNKEFLPLYQEICIMLDFSDSIKKIGDTFIHNQFGNTPFIAIHLRYPDVLNGKNFETFTHGVSEIMLLTQIYAHAEKIYKNEISLKTFVATNKQNILSKKLSTNMFSENHELNSFIEQYICAKSFCFYLSPVNDYQKLNEPHQRSSWSSFVSDYRYFKLNNNNNYIYTYGQNTLNFNLLSIST